MFYLLAVLSENIVKKCYYFLNVYLGLTFFTVDMIVLFIVYIFVYSAFMGMCAVHVLEDKKFLPPSQLIKSISKLGFWDAFRVIINAIKLFFKECIYPSSNLGLVVHWCLITNFIIMGFIWRYRSYILDFLSYYCNYFFLFVFFYFFLHFFFLIRWIRSYFKSKYTPLINLIFRESLICKFIIILIVLFLFFLDVKFNCLANIAHKTAMAFQLIPYIIKTDAFFWTILYFFFLANYLWLLYFCVKDACKHYKIDIF